MQSSTRFVACKGPRRAEDERLAVCHCIQLKRVRSHLCLTPLFHISHLRHFFASMSDKKSAKKLASKVSTSELLGGRSFNRVPRGRGFQPWLVEMSQKRGFVSWMAGHCRLSRRQLANLARVHEIPRAKNNYNRDWGANVCATATLIRDLKRFRKGNRKGPRTRRRPPSLLDQFSRAVHRIDWLTQVDRIEALQKEIRCAKRARLLKINASLMGLIKIAEAISRRLQVNARN